MLSVYKARLETEFNTRERCSIVELLNDGSFPAFSIARCRVEPGVTTELHALTGTHEVYVLLQGKAQMSDGRTSSETLEPMDCVLIPAGHPQQVSNIGTEDLIFLAVCNERFQQDAYVVVDDSSATA